MKTEKELFEEEYAEELKSNPGMSPEEFAKKYGLDLPEEYRKNRPAARASTGNASPVQGNRVSTGVKTGVELGRFSRGGNQSPASLGNWNNSRRQTKTSASAREISREEQIANREMEEQYNRTAGSRFDTSGIDGILGEPYKKSRQERNSLNQINRQYADRQAAHERAIQERENARREEEEALLQRYSEVSPAAQAAGYEYPNDPVMRARMEQYLTENGFNDYVISQKLDLNDEAARDKLNLDNTKKMLEASVQNSQFEQSKVDNTAREEEKAKASWEASINRTVDAAAPYLTDEFDQGVKDNFGSYKNMVEAANDENNERHEMAKYYRDNLYSIAHNTNPALNFVYSAGNGFFANAFDAAEYNSQKKYWEEMGYPKATDYTYEEIRQMSHPILSTVGTTLGDASLAAASLATGPVGLAITIADNGVSNLTDYIQDEKSGGEAVTGAVTGTLFDIGTGRLGKSVGSAVEGVLDAKPVQNGVKNLWNEAYSTATEQVFAPLKETVQEAAKGIVDAVKQGVSITQDQATELNGVLEQEAERMLINPDFQRMSRAERENLLRQRFQNILSQFQEYVAGQR